jgi:hypothetical protein
VSYALRAFYTFAYFYSDTIASPRGQNSLPYFGRMRHVNTIGLRDFEIYGTLDDNQASGPVLVDTTSYNFHCGQIPGVSLVKPPRPWVDKIYSLQGPNHTGYVDLPGVMGKLLDLWQRL